MSSGSAQDVAVEHFLRDIERRSKRLHCAVIGCEEERPRSDMNLLYRKSRLDWRQRDQTEVKEFQPKRPFSHRWQSQRFGVFPPPLPDGFHDDAGVPGPVPHSCASAMAPRSQSCHAVGAGDSLENGDDSDTQSQHGGRCPPHQTQTSPQHSPQHRPATAEDSVTRRPPRSLTHTNTQRRKI
ncbi:hypothetical protein KUCAC02_003587, partial [Chaenocephalus aceratus]